MSAALIGTGNSFPYTPSIDISKGTIVKEGAVVGIVNLDVLANKTGTFLVGGFFSIPRESGVVFVIGDRVYCDLAGSPQEATDDNTKEYIGTYVEDNPISSDWIHFIMNASFRENTAPPANVYDVYANLAAFPVTGVAEVFYIADDTKKLYVYTGGVYQEISLGGIDLTSVTGLLKGNGSVISAVVSGTDIKTINSTSLLGSGDIAISSALADGDYGDITVSVTGTVFTIDNGVVSNAKLATVPTLTMKGKNTAGTGAPLDLSVTDIRTMLLLDSSADQPFTQPSAITIWTIIHGLSYKPQIAFFNATSQKVYPLEDHSIAGQVALIFGTPEIHTALVLGRGSVIMRNDKIITVLASVIVANSNIFDVVTAKNVVITMDVAITGLTFVGTPADLTELNIAFDKGATAFACTLDTSKFKGDVSNPIPSPLLLATVNTRDVLRFLMNGVAGKMSLVGNTQGS